MGVPGDQSPQLRALDMSGASGPARLHLSIFDYGWNFSLPAGITEHLLHSVLALQDVDVFERGSLALEVLTGLSSVRSCVFAENEYFFLHDASHFCIT